MAKKDIATTSANIKTAGNNNNVHVHIEHPKKNDSKEKKPHWVVKAVVLALIGALATLLVYYMENAGNHGQPTHSPKPAILPDKK